jgi:hypothetical protein
MTLSNAVPQYSENGDSMGGSINDSLSGQIGCQKVVK